MEPAIKVAIGALTISFLSLIAVIINSVFTAKTYKKNRRLEFLQRRDLLSQKISDLNERNTEAQLISARYELVAVKNAGLRLPAELAETNTVVTASIRERRDGVEERIKLWNVNIEKLHNIYSKLTQETDAPEVEELIAITQVASDNLKKVNIGYSSTLHILETTNDFIKAHIAESDEMRRQINAEFDEKIRQINLDFDRRIERLM